MIDNLKIQTDNVITDLNDDIINAKFSLYPNPMKGNSIKIESQSGLHQIVFKLFDTEGQLEFEKSIESSGIVELEIPSRLKNGIYIALIENQEVLESYKLIIDR